MNKNDKEWIQLFAKDFFHAEVGKLPCINHGTSIVEIITIIKSEIKPAIEELNRKSKALEKKVIFGILAPFLAALSVYVVGKFF